LLFLKKKPFRESGDYMLMSVQSDFWATRPKDASPEALLHGLHVHDTAPECLSYVEICRI
jgi:hypothetical protein